MNPLLKRLYLRKTLLILTSLLILLCLFTFRTPIMRFYITHSIHQHLFNHLQAKINWKKTTFKDNEWIWEGCILEDINTKEILISSGEIHFSPSFFFFPWNIQLSIAGTLELPPSSKKSSPLLSFNIEKNNSSIKGNARFLFSSHSFLALVFENEQPISASFQQVNGLHLIDLPLLKNLFLDSTFLHHTLDGEIKFSKSSSGLHLSSANLLLNHAEGGLSNFNFFEQESIGIFELNLQNLLKITGTGEINADYSKQRLVITSLFNTLKAENNSILIDHSNPISRAVYYIDFTNGDHGGSLSLKNASLYEKIHNLLFYNIHTNITFTPSHLIFTDLEAYCEDIFFQGEINLDLPNTLQEPITLNVSTPIIYGQVSSVKRLLNHFSSSQIVLEAPINGYLVTRNTGGHLLLTFFKNEIELSCHIQGSLSEGEVVTSNHKLQNITCNFDYTLETNSLLLSDIQGFLKTGPPNDIEEYVLSGEKIDIPNLSKKEIKFDFWVGDKNRDILRLAGQTFETQSSKEKKITLELDSNLTHFGNIHPSHCNIIFSDSGNLNECSIQLPFALGGLLYDLKKVCQANWFYLPPYFLESIMELKEGSGNFLLTFDYKESNETLSFCLNAEEVSINKAPFQSLILKGKIKDKIWSIESLKLDNLNLFSELQKENKNWKLDFLGVEYKDILLAGIEGTIFHLPSWFNGKINLLELNLSNFIEGLKIRYLPFQVETDQNGNIFIKNLICTLFYPDQKETLLAFNEPTINIKEQKVSFKTSENSFCHLQWKKNNNGDYLINTIQGDFFGIKINLSHDSKINTLEGLISFSSKNLPEFIPQKWKNLFKNLPNTAQWTFNGSWQFNCCTFEGTMKTENYHLHGYLFSPIEAKISMKDSLIQISHLTINNSLIKKINIPSIFLNFHEKSPLLSIPQLQIDQVQIGSSKKKSKENNPFLSELFIEKMVMNNFTGILGNPQTYKGDGYIQWKKQNEPILAHTISQQNLIPKHLFPSSGEVTFKLDNQSLLFNSLKNSYSSGRLFKYSLSKEKDGISKIEFNGSLDLHLRMKQQNLLLRLADPHLINISGTIKNPIIQLLK